jgi:hypothetical protein
MPKDFQAELWFRTKSKDKGNSPHAEKPIHLVANGYVLFLLSM